MNNLNCKVCGQPCNNRNNPGQEVKYCSKECRLNRADNRVFFRSNYKEKEMEWQNKQGRTLSRAVKLAYKEKYNREL